ncbi:MAG: tRNA lysidine(34) synthetase TilS [Aphanocapsa sp. GSE-SYN-MK-11-07L]|jgi:tRNA(Ile)-lysidine synthase|nr:tRNA lysidine(34) synthetase TilS [Aphanocapsa sp. GSE-SYN-MK-11-07L]
MSWTSLHGQIHRTLRHRQLLPSGQRLLVAVSGGQDSLCLVKLLLDLQPKWSWDLAIAHCDHGWRADSAANAQYIAALAQQWQLPFFLEAANLAQFGTKTEAAARQWRYQALETIAQAHQYSAVITGHTASDRAETLLYNLIRGSGTDGLQALVWQRALTPKIQLVRPLLGVSRTATAQFCTQQGLTIWQDSSNQDLNYRRNRIRQELLPYLQTHFNPQAERAIAQTAEVLQAEVAYLVLESDRLLHSAQPSADQSTWAGLNRDVLRQAPLALQRRAIRQFLQTNLATMPTFDQIETVVGLLTAPHRSRSESLPGRAIAEVDADWIWLKVLPRNQDSPKRVND